MDYNMEPWLFPEIFVGNLCMNNASFKSCCFKLLWR